MIETFFKVKTTEEVLEILKQFGPCSIEEVNLDQAVGRVIAEDITSPEDLPEFHRSSMDGYAVRAKDTFGASESLPAFLEVAGEIPMGEIPHITLQKGQAAKISTGGMLPKGADAVVMIEYCHELDEATIEVTRSVSPLENVIAPGDDVKAGQCIFKKGKRLRAQDVGLLAGLGIDTIKVFSKPRIAIISTGDEIVDIRTKPLPGEVRDINRYSLAAFCRALGAIPLPLGRCSDDFDSLKQLISKGLKEADSIWISGGSSVGTRDLTLKVFETFHEFQLLVHGISISPGKPTIIGKIGQKPIIGLPGHVSSALIVAEVFLSPLLALMSGDQGIENISHTIRAQINRNVESASGRDEFVRVKLTKKDGLMLAEPIFGKSGLISTMVEGDGLVRIHRNKEGLYAGEEVDVLMFSSEHLSFG